MRPVNLIPSDERRGDSAPTRLGSISYVLLGALAVALVGVVAVALTSKQISDKESEKQHLEQELAAASQRAESLRSFTDFRSVQETRQATITSLAQSRFDWERVLNELARVMPADVWLINLTGTVSPTVQLENSAEVASRESVAGPALEMVGCATGQEAVAGFVSSLEDIDGVTRVGLESSEQNEEVTEDAGATETTAGAAEAASEDCRTESFIFQFKLVVAFDAVPTPATATEAPGVPATGTTDPAQLAGAPATAAAPTGTAPGG